MGEPKYDEDVVNLGFLKKIVSDPEGNLENIYQNVSKHYASKPQPPYHKGDTWIDGSIIYICINDREIGIYTDSDWTTESGAKEEAERKNKVFLRQPSNYNVGDMWILQSDDDHKAGKKGEILITTAGRKVYDEGDWVNMLGYGTIASINEVANDLNDAIERIGVTEEAISDGIIITFYQNTIPEGIHIGDLWYVTESVDMYIKGKLYRYDGTIWEILDDPAITEAFEEANQARLVADGKIQSFYSATAPTENIGVGDLWIDTDDNNKLYRYNGTNWVAVYDTRIDEIQTEIETITETTVEITTDLGKITERVSETETVLETTKNTAENAKSSAEEANTKILATNTKVGELEIEAGAIKETVSSHTESIEKVQEQTDLNTDEIAKMGSTETAEGTELNINASNNPAKLQVWGKTEQATRSGINQLMPFKEGETDYFYSITNVNNSATDYYKAVPLADNWVHMECDCTGATAKHYINAFIGPDKIPNLKPSTAYTFVMEFRNVDITKMTGTFNIGKTHTSTADDFFTKSASIGSSHIKSGLYKFILDTFDEANFIGTTMALRDFHTINPGDKFSYEFRMSILEGNYINKDYEYELFGVMPSPDYPSPIENVGDNINIIPTDVEAWEQGSISAEGKLTEVVSRIRTKNFYKIKSGEQYTCKIYNTKYNIVNIAFFDKDENFITNVSKLLNIIEFPLKPTTFTVPNNAHFIKAIIKNRDNVSTITANEILETKLKVEQGSIATPYTPYGCGSIDVLQQNENFYNRDNQHVAYAGSQGKINEDKSITIQPLKTGGVAYAVTDYYEFEIGKKYTVSLKAEGNFYLLALFSSLYTSPKSTSKKSLTFTLQEGDETKLAIGFYVNASSLDNSLTISDISIVEGDLTDYKPHKEEQYHFLFTKGQLLHKDDYLSVDGIHFKRKTIVLDGTENWQLQGAGTENWFYTITHEDRGNVIADQIICTHYKYANITGSNTNEGIDIISDYIRIRYGTEDTIANWKAFLAQQYANGTPVTIEYKLAEEEIVPYTPAQQEVLDNIETFKGINHIYCIDEIIPEKILLEYYPNTPFNNTLVNKDTFDKVTTDMSAEFNIKANEVETKVKDETTATILTLLNNGYLTADQVNALVNGNAEDIATVKEQLKQTVTSSQMQIEITKAIEGGVSYLKNTLFTIDENGMAIATSEDEFNALYNNKGMYLYSYEEMIAKFDVNGANITGNLKVDGEIETQNLRMMNVEVDGVPHVHIHWIGG